MIGAWEFSNADHDRVCHFNFRSDAVTGGFKLDIDKNCPNLFPSTKDMVAWSLDQYGDLRLLDAQGKEVVELTEVEGNRFGQLLSMSSLKPPVTASERKLKWQTLS